MPRKITMDVMKTLLVAVCLAVCVLVPLVGRAECIGIPGTLQQVFDRYPIVFVADVLAVDESIEPDPIPFRYRVRFRVVEPFKGIDAGERVLYFAASPDDFEFTTGTRVLVYASRSSDRYHTTCTPTRVIPSNDRAEEIRKLVSGAKRP